MINSPIQLTLHRVPETLSEDVLKLLHAPAKPDYPVIAPADLANYDAFLFGVPTRYGTFPAQWKVITPCLSDKITETDT